MLNKHFATQLNELMHPPGGVQSWAEHSKSLGGAGGSLKLADLAHS